MLLAGSRRDPSIPLSSPACTAATPWLSPTPIGGNGFRQRLTQAGMGQDEVVIHLEQRQLLTQSIFTLTRRGAAPSNGRHPLTQAEIAPFHKRCIHLPAAGGQDLLDGPLRAKHHAVLHLDEAPSPHGLDHLRIEQLRQWHPAWLGGRTCGLFSRRLHPAPEMRHDGGEIIRLSIAQKERHTTGRQQLSDLMQHGLGHRQGAFPSLDAQQQLALGIDCGPHPVGGPREPLDRLVFTDGAVSHRPEDGVEFVELHLMQVSFVEKIRRKGVQLLRGLHEPAQHGVGVDLKDPRRASDAQTFGQTRHDAYDELR
jgi:hypothetical protein